MPVLDAKPESCALTFWTTSMVLLMLDWRLLKFLRCISRKIFAASIKEGFESPRTESPKPRSWSESKNGSPYKSCIKFIILHPFPLGWAQTYSNSRILYCYATNLLNSHLSIRRLSKTVRKILPFKYFIILSWFWKCSQVHKIECKNLLTTPR